MAKTPPTLVKGSTKAYKFEEHYPQKPCKSSARPLFAFFSSILIYTSIFYIFNLSPSTLFYNTKFWFAISNTLIFIIAADYSSSKDKFDQISYQEEYMMHRQAQNTSSFVSEYPRKIETITDHPVAHQTTSNSSFVSEYPLELETNTDHQAAHQKIETPENRLTVLKDEHDENSKPPTVDETDAQEKRTVHVQPKVCKKKKNVQAAKTYKRSKSEEVRRAVTEECKSDIMRRSETMEKKHEENQVRTPEEDNEFSTMSNEELNRRFEDFIQRFNEQIRHQSAADRTPRLTYVPSTYV